MKKIFLLVMLCWQSCFAIKVTNIQGGIARVPLDISSESTPNVLYQGNKVMVTKENSGWVAYVGIGINSPAGENILEIENNAGVKFTKNFNVQKKKYLTEYLEIKNKDKVNPPKSFYDRIIREHSEIKTVFKMWTKSSISNLDLIMPTTGRNSNNFGYKRVLNGQPKSPHLGLDISAPEGTPVKAAKSGKVVKVGDFYFSGNTVFIDHGQGLITGYSHLSKIYTKEGDTVETGKIIGEVGKTGRATGNHLHWTVSLNGIKVDPNLFVSE